MNDEIVNRVASSGLISFDLEDYYVHGERVQIDLKDNLYMEMVLREKEFREFIKTNDWNKYKDKLVAVTCTADAIIPTWAFMLIVSRLSGIARKVVYGNLSDLDTILYQEALQQINPEEFRDRKVVVKGCSKHPVPTSAYVMISNILTPFVTSLMFGEPCSTVPVFKKAKTHGE